MIVRQPDLTGKRAEKGTQGRQAVKTQKKVKNLVRHCDFALKFRCSLAVLLVGFGIN